MSPFLERVDLQKTMKAHAFILLKESRSALCLVFGLKREVFLIFRFSSSPEYESGAIKVTEAYSRRTHGFCDELSALAAAHLVEPGAA
jgi:hypothetical protein